MKFKRNILSLAVYSAVLTLMGCGVTSQDNGTGAAGAGAVSGVAVDGYIAFSVVYVDTNKNNKLDVWESRALTDGEGYFTYNPNNPDGSKNYCELAETHKNYKHCLKIPAGYEEVMIRMTQGYDLSTTEPFTGTLSMMVSSNSSDLATINAGTPVTGLMAEMSSDEKTSFLTAEGITSIAELDFLNFGTDNVFSTIESERLTMLTLAMRIHKIADSIAGYLDSALNTSLGRTDDGIFDVAEGMPTDGSVYVYKAIVERMTSQNKTVTELLTDANELEGIISSSIANMKEAIEALDSGNNFDFTAGTYSDPSITQLAADEKRLSDVIAAAFTSPLVAAGSYTNSASATVDYTIEDDAKGRIRAVDIMAYLIRSNAGANAITNAETLAGDATYLANLKSPKVDVAGLKSKFVNVASPTDLDATAADYDARQSFTQLFGTTTTGFTGSDGQAANEGGFAGNELNIGEGTDSVGVAFVGETDDATSGTMSIDASFADGEFASEDGSATQLEGTWEQLDEYTMLMNIEVAGVVQPVIIKPTLDDQGNTAYYYDMGGEQQVWTP